ncbi:response regulator transcription factor [Bacillus sp. B-jedd]|uniref:response regulator transcription factor n=1 Tax=Bacillus sp. B-jedd TaxID=1476857 RepID=UPI0005155723|nr:response regulator transcription factor [Bacillus sp. B-jedd]CEG29341.1 two-component response regulator [Bacillus sp. B-jedd]
MNLLIVDDHEIVRDGLSMIMQQAYCIDEERKASNGYEAIGISETFPADLVLLDISMPGGLDGLETLEKMRKLLPKSKIVIFSMFEDIGFQRKAYLTGADGYLIKQLKRDEMIRSIDEILANRKVFNKIVFKQNDRPETEEILELPISKREKEVFVLTVMGYTLKEISERLGITPKTVDNHRYKIGEKLETQKRRDWVELAKVYHIL